MSYQGTFRAHIVCCTPNPKSLLLKWDEEQTNSQASTSTHQDLSIDHSKRNGSLSDLILMKAEAAAALLPLCTKPEIKVSLTLF